MACKDYHDHGPDEGFRRVLDYEGGDWNVAEDGTVSQDAFAYHISLALQPLRQPRLHPGMPHRGHASR